MKSLIIIALAGLLVACGQPTQFDCIGTKTETTYLDAQKDGPRKTAHGFMLTIGKKTHFAEGLEFYSGSKDGATLIHGGANYEGPSLNSASQNSFTFDRNTQEIKKSQVTWGERRGSFYETHTDFVGKCVPSK